MSGEVRPLDVKKNFKNGSNKSGLLWNLLKKALLYKATDFLGRKFCGLSSGSIASHAAIFGEKKLLPLQ